MLPPDFEERKRAAQRQSALMRFLDRLREHRLDPNSFPHRLVPEADEQPLHDAIAPWLRVVNEQVERVSGWETVSERVAKWAIGKLEIAVFFNDLGPTGWLVVPGGILFAHLDAFWKASAMRHFLFLVTPDTRAGVMYFVDEHESVFAVWGES